MTTFRITLYGRFLKYPKIRQISVRNPKFPEKQSVMTVMRMMNVTDPVDASYHTEKTKIRTDDQDHSKQKKQKINPEKNSEAKRRISHERSIQRLRFGRDQSP